MRPLRRAGSALLSALSGLGARAGASLVFSAYFITLPQSVGGGATLRNSLIAGAVIFAAHASAWLLRAGTPAWLPSHGLGFLAVARPAADPGQGGWARKAVLMSQACRCTLEVGLFFLCEQNISTARDSKMYMPSELTYFLPVTCAFFALPPIVTPGAQAPLRALWGLSSVAVWVYLSVFTMQDKASLQPHSYPSPPVTTSLLICLLALVFCSPVGPPGSKPQAGLGGALGGWLRDTALLAVAVSLLFGRRGFLQAAPERMRDFYSIRTVTNIDRILSSVGGSWATPWKHAGGLLQGADAGLRPYMVFIPLHIRVHTLLASCYWFNRVASGLDGLAAEALHLDAAQGVHLRELHILLAVCTVALGFFCVSRGRDHNTFLAVDSDGQTVWHSMRLLWGLCAALGVGAASGLLHWVSTLLWRSRSNRHRD